jgi:hypothetical protein
MKFATATAVVLASALSALAHAESAVNEAPAQLLAMNQLTADWIEPKLKAPAMVMPTAEANAELAELALNKVAEKLERQLEQRLERDLAETR